MSPIRGLMGTGRGGDRHGGPPMRHFSALPLLAVLAALGLAASAPSASAQAPPGAYAAHSMVYAYGMPLAEKERAFAEAKAMGASEIRLDLELNSVFTRQWGTVWRSWGGVDQVMALSR